MQDPSLEDALDTTMADRMADLAALGFGRKPQGNARGSLNFAQRDQIRREDKGYRDGFRNIIGEKDGLGGWAADAIPGIGAGAQIADMNRLLHAAEAYNAGTANQAQVDLAVNFYDQNQREGGFMSGVGELASGSIQMLPSLLTATALVSASGKAITGAVAKKTLEKMMKSMAERGMVANVATGMAARGAVGALGNEALSLFTRPFGGRGAIERSAFEMVMAERMNISADEAGELFITLSGASKNLVKHLPKAIFSEMVELGTEQMGGAINYAKTLTPEGAALSFLGREYTKLVGVVGKSKAAKKINAAFGVDDILTEYGEELVAAGTRDVAAVLSGGYLADGGNIESLFEPENLAIMLGGVGHMNLAMRSTSNVVGGTFEKFAESDRKKREAKDAEEIAEEESERSDSKPTTGLPDDPGAENTDTTDEGASGTQPVVGPTWTPEERARDVARLRESNSPFGGDDTLAPLTLAQEREPDISDEVSWIRKTAEKLGINVQFVTRNWTKEQHEAEEADIAARRAAGEDVETRHTGVFVGEGRIIIDIDSFDAIGLMFHESTHHLEKVDKAAFDRLYELMMQLDPEGMAAAEAAQREAGGEMNKGEFAAVRAEQLANVLTALQSDAKMTRIRRVLRDKGGRSALKKVFEVVIDMLAMVDAKHFGEIDTARKRMNDALSAIGDPNGTRTDLEVAMAVHDAMRGMREVFDASASTTRRRDRRQARDTARQERSEERAAAQADAEGTAASAAAARARTEQAISDAQAAIERDPANQKAVTEQAIADVIALMDEAARAESKQETLDAIEAAEEAIQAQITGTERQITLAAIDKARADIEAAPAEAAKAETLSAIADAQEAIGAAVAAARADEARTHVEATAKTEAREQKSTRGAEKERKRRERAAK
ncbi:MAG: hypothetical protein OSB57_04215, partial [Planctomycetota bacterium]|nr:hypothetical protein [Planctomycetota bacterium]